jgi:hypothetical protein
LGAVVSYLDLDLDPDLDLDLDLDPDLDLDLDLDLSRPRARREPGTAAARNGAWPRGVEEAGLRSFVFGPLTGQGAENDER